jgi:hypothetical protein
MPIQSTIRAADSRIILTFPLRWSFLCTVEMKNTFAQSTKLTPAPVGGWMAICHRYARPFGIVGKVF